MAIYLSGISALEFWHNERKDSYHPYGTLKETLQHVFESNYERVRARVLKGTSITDDDFRKALVGRLSRLETPIHILAPDAAARRNTAIKTYHVWGGALPRGAFYRIADDVYVSSPAFCYLQLAPKLSLLDLIQLGNEMCGAYVASAFEARGLRRCCPMTTVEELLSFLKRASWGNGSRQARRAAKRVAYGLASPMETAQHMILCLPLLLGGQGISGARVNHPIDMTLAIQASLDGDHCLCDLYWPERGLTVEYNGKDAHVDVERDNERVNRLLSIGITTVPVAKGQLYSMEKTDVLARQIRKQLGVQVPAARFDHAWRKRALELRKLVLPPNSQAIERILASAQCQRAGFVTSKRPTSIQKCEP